MQAIEFSKLNFQDRLQWVLFEGEFVMDIRYYEFKINLYRIHDFFIEVYFHHKQAYIQKIEVLDRSSNRMKFYADQVKLEQFA